jgi:hypothetical protein
MLLALIVVAGLAIDFLLYTGFFASDDIGYFGGGEMFATGSDYVGPQEIHPTLSIARLGNNIPTGVVYWLSGGEVGVIAWFYVLYHLALVIVAFAVGRRVHGERTGLIAAALVATNPVLSVYAGAILPDNATALWVALLLLVLERIRQRSLAGPLAWREAFPAHFAAGVLLGLAYSVKETGIIMVVPAAVCVMAAAPRLRDPVWIRNGAFMAAGLIAFMIAELVVIRLITGDWLVRLAAVDEAGETMAYRIDEQGGANPLARMWFALDVRLFPIAPLTTVILLAGAIAYPFFRKDRSLPLILFFWWAFLYVTAGSTSFTSYLPSSIQARYYALVILPAAVMTARVGLELLRRWKAWARPPSLVRGRGAGVALGIALIAVVSHEVSGNADLGGTIYMAERARGFEATYARARAEYPQYPVVLSWFYSRRMRPLWLPHADQLYAGDFGGLPTPPEPPYIYLESRKELRKAPREPEEGLEVRTLEVVYPLRDRSVIVGDSLRRLFALRLEEPRRAGTLAAGVIQLVTRSGSAGESLGVSRRTPLIARNNAAKVERSDPGHLVSWTSQPDFTLQLDRGGSYKTAPPDPTSQLPTGTRRVRISVDLRLVSGRNARLSGNGFGYDAAGTQTVRSEAKAALTARGAPTTLTFELASDQPLSAFRVRIKVKSGSSWPGSLHVGERRVEVVPAEQP